MFFRSESIYQITEITDDNCAVEGIPSCCRIDFIITFFRRTARVSVVPRDDSSLRAHRIESDSPHLSCIFAHG